MKDREIDEILRQAGQAPPDVNPALLEGIAKSVGSSLRPVRPLPAAWVVTGGLVIVSGCVALAGAARAGFYGLHKLSALECGILFPALAVLIWLAAESSVTEMVPGSQRRLAPASLLGAASLLLVAIFAGLFHDYRTDHFVSEGIVCLTAGLLHAIPAALVSWLLLRRGFAVNAVAAGIAVGTLAALAGVTMLELHCANFQVLHVMLWHTAVIPVSAGAGALLARTRRLR